MNEEANEKIETIPHPYLLGFETRNENMPRGFNFIGTKNTTRRTMDTFLLQSFTCGQTTSKNSPNKMLDLW